MRILSTGEVVVGSSSPSTSCGGTKFPFTVDANGLPFTFVGRSNDSLVEAFLQSTYNSQNNVYEYGAMTPSGCSTSGVDFWKFDNTNNRANISLATRAVSGYTYALTVETSDAKVGIGKCFGPSGNISNPNIRLEVFDSVAPQLRLSQSMDVSIPSSA